MEWLDSRFQIDGATSGYLNVILWYVIISPQHDKLNMCDNNWLIALNGFNDKISLSRWEIQILKCIKSKAKTESKIATQISLNIPVVSLLITDLMMQGYVERTRKRRMYFFTREYFSLTLEGLTNLEAVRSQNNNFWTQILSILRL